MGVTNRKPHLVAVAHAKTDASESQTLRYEIIESVALLFIREQLRAGPFSGVIREIWPPSRDYRLNDKIHGAWSAVDRALARYGYEVTANITPTTVKKTVTGNGKAEKAEVAAAVRRLLGLAEDYRFATDDESDAAAVVLAWLIGQNLIDVEER
ncbi:crossover junction endodeoxyribonuclease RuvC [Brevibacillus sp. WF146]|nr:crossover junction endodeoxyribonuclease RuvC [Brevibacillus sp. WF146]UYZ15589.1 crossover junction endodeoxyribonuclease RuvC [Brevibacillus sp. WF146]